MHYWPVYAFGCIFDLWAMLSGSLSVQTRATRVVDECEEFNSHKQRTIGNKPNHSYTHQSQPFTATQPAGALVKLEIGFDPACHHQIFSHSVVLPSEFEFS